MVKREKVSLKIIVLGDDGVGKTSLLKRYVRKGFRNNCNATIGVDLLTKKVVVDNHIVTLQIWDTAGKECFRSAAIGFSQEADACSRPTFRFRLQKFKRIQVQINDSEIILNVYLREINYPDFYN